MVQARYYSVQYIQDTEEVCGRATGEQHKQFCMQATGECSILAHNRTRQVSSGKRSTSCVQRTIYLKVTTVDSEVAVEPVQASYRVNENDFPNVDLDNFFDQLLLNYVTALRNCSNDSEAIRIFNTFVNNAEVRRRELVGDNDEDESESESEDKEKQYVIIGKPWK